MARKVRVAKSNRQGVGKGMGSGYKNLIPKDPKVHSDSGRGIKQPQRFYYIKEPFGLPRELQPKDKFYTEAEEKIKDTYVSEVTLPYNSEKFKIYSDKLVVINGQLFETKEDLKLMPKKVTIKFDNPMKDSDGDGMPDFMDCNPNDRNKQDWKEVGQEITSSFGKNVGGVVGSVGGLVTGAGNLIGGVGKAVGGVGEGIEELSRARDYQKRKEYIQELENLIKLRRGEQ